MGMIIHHAIVVTSWDKKLLRKAHDKAEKVFVNVSNIVDAYCNGYSSFFVAPDGSKEGWEDSLNGDARRQLFIRWIKSQAYDDGGNSLEYVEIEYGNDTTHNGG